MKTKHLCLLLLMINAITISAQNIYTTDEGHILIMSQVDNKNVQAESHNLSIFLNYTSKEVNGYLDLKTLDTKYASINNALKESEEPLKVHFTGTIPVTDFMFPGHDPITFSWLVTITYEGENYQALFNSTILHVDEGLSVSCLLSANGELDISETGLKNIIPELDDILQIRFSQLLLRLE